MISPPALKKLHVIIIHLIVRFHQNLVVLAERHQEHDGCHVLKAVDPLPPLGPLTADVHHPVPEDRKQSRGAKTIADLCESLFLRGSNSYYLVWSGVCVCVCRVACMAPVPLAHYKADSGSRQRMHAKSLRWRSVVRPHTVLFLFQS